MSRPYVNSIRYSFSCIDEIYTQYIHPTNAKVRLQADVFDKSEALDRERLEVACLRQDIIDEYEKKSAELIKYLDSMESAFDHQRSEYEDRETSLRRENEELRHELAHGCRYSVQRG